MNRPDALALLQEYTKNEALLKHMYSVEAAMRAYARKFNQDEEVQRLLAEIQQHDKELESLCANYSRANGKKLLGKTFDRAAISARGLNYERLDQLTMEVIMGVR